MSITTIEGVVENGQIRLPASVRLPERAKVYVIVPDREVPTKAYVASPHLVHPEQAADFEKDVAEESPDARL